MMNNRDFVVGKCNEFVEYCEELGVCGEFVVRFKDELSDKDVADVLYYLFYFRKLVDSGGEFGFEELCNKLIDGGYVEWWYVEEKIWIVWRIEWFGEENIWAGVWSC